MIEDVSPPSNPVEGQSTPLSPDDWAAQLATQYSSRLRVFAARRLRDRSAADDVVQETLRRVLEAIRADRIRDVNAIVGFVFETARHVCMQRGRSASRESSAMDRLAQTPQLAIRERAPDPLTDLINEEQCSAVRKALTHLDDEDRQLIRWSYVESVDSAEIGRRLGITAGAARARRHRALEKLAEILDVTSPRDRAPKG